MWKTIAGFSLLVVFLVVVVGFAAKSFHNKPKVPGHPVVVVVSDYSFCYFGASWCEPCQRMQHGTLKAREVIAAMEAKFGFNQAVYDIDTVPKLAQSMQIDLVPTYLIYQEDKIIKRKSGYLGPKAFLEWIK